MLDVSRTRWIAGATRAIRIAMMAITTNSSIRVNPARFEMHLMDFSIHQISPAQAQVQKLRSSIGRGKRHLSELVVRHLFEVAKLRHQAFALLTMFLVSEHRQGVMADPIPKIDAPMDDKLYPISR